MSDLISRSEAIQRIMQETIDSKNNLIHINAVKRLLQDVDTAYDVDKVVAELVKSAKESNGNVGMGGEMVVNLDDAIEIGKQGGVADDVCEWKFEETTGITWHCNNECTTYNPSYVKNLKIILDDFECKCPYCGKKIKIVGDNNEN